MFPTNMFPTKKIIGPVFVAAIAFAGCASAPSDSPELIQLDAKLKTASSDRYIAEYGQDDLVKAGTSLAAARVAFRSGHDSEFQHELTMGEGYVALGGIHGEQERVKAETVALKAQQEQVRLSARDADVRQANDRANVSRLDAAVANAAVQNAEAATQAAENNAAAMRAQLSVYDLKITELGATLVLHDVMFDTNSAELRTGAIDRLAPLASYLRASPKTSVRIEGHTDNTGTAERNNELSLNRADAVKRALMSGAGITNAVETSGAGEAKPVATNTTVSGREQNRRVEITLQ